MAEAVRVSVPQEGVNDESARIVCWRVTSGSIVKRGCPICEVETSKAVLEMEAPESGVVQYWAEVGTEVAVGSIIFQILPDEHCVSTSATDVLQSAASLNTPTPPARLTNAAAQAATENGLDESAFPRGTLVRLEDVVQKVVEMRGKAVQPTARRNGEGYEKHSKTVAAIGVSVEWTEIPRRKVLEGRILRRGRACCVQSSVTSSLRMHELRSRMDKLGFSSLAMTALIIFETARLLHRFPAFNAVHEHGRMGHYLDINIGWTIDADRGLVVPVIRNADQKTHREICSTMQQQLEAYLGNTLSTDDFLGSTFTVSDLSGEGVSIFQPLISRGQSAILGVGKDSSHGQTELLYLTLAFDHQLAEGKAAARLLSKLRDRLESHANAEMRIVTDRELSNGELYCVLCQRDEKILKNLRAILVRTESPPGLVCSLCLKGY